MKKVIILMLVICLTLVPLVACKKDVGKDTTKDNGTQGDGNGQDQDDTEPTVDMGGRTIRYAAWWDLEPVAGSAEWADLLIGRVADMKEKYNFELQYLNVPFDQILEQFTATTLAGEPFAEISWVASHWFYPGLVTNGFVYPIEELGVFDFAEEKWNSSIISASVYDGKTYGFATGGPDVRTCMFFNTTMFEREGLPSLYELVQNKQWTWDKMLEIALKATKDLDGDGSIDQWGLNAGLEWPLIYSNYAESIITVDGKAQFGLTDTKAIEALQFWQDLLHVHKVCDIPPDGSSWDYSIQQFQDGVVAMSSGQWWITERLQPNMVDDYGLVLFPMGPKADDYVMHTDEVVFQVIPSGVKNPEEIAMFFDQYSDPFPELDEGEDDWKEGFLNQARDKETVDITMQMIKDKNYMKLSNWRSFQALEQLGWSFFWQINSGNKTPQVAIDEIALEAQSILDDAFAK